MRAEATGVSEFDAIRRFAERYPAVGDDAAVLAGGLLAAADAIVEGVDFTAASALADVGWRAVTVNASDIAAMGGVAESLLVSVVGPPALDLDRLYAGIDEACDAYGCEVVGGDLSNGSAVVVAVTVLGRCDAPVLRSGARAGDVVWATGPFGAAAASGYAARPLARLAEGVAARVAGATAMIDVSDGFAADLAHICDASRVGVVVEHAPVAGGATEAQALGGGDDYELLFTLPADAAAPAGSIRVGTIVADVDARPPAVEGWQHRFS
jgi:thiamine-monophosphate kinase